MAIKKIVKDSIQIPDIPDGLKVPITKLKHTDKFNAGFSRIKYVVIIKFNESKRDYKKWGIKRHGKDYGVGILTEENDYYFSILTMNHRYLSFKHVKQFNSMFANRFIITKDTKVLFSDNINEKTEPLSLYWTCLGTAIQLKISHASIVKMLTLLNRYYQYVHPCKNRKFGNWHKKPMIKKLLDHDCFEFITDPEWKYSLDNMDHKLRDAHIYTAIGILYCYFKDYYREIALRWKNKSAEKSKSQ